MRKVNHSERSCLAVGAGAGDQDHRISSECLARLIRPNTGGANPHALPFDVVQTKVTDHIAGCIVVGYTLWNDLSPPKLPTLDTIFIAYQYNFAVQAENARACMDLFRCIEREQTTYDVLDPESGPTPRQGSASTTAINPTTSAAYRLLLTSQPSTKHTGFAKCSHRQTACLGCGQYDVCFWNSGGTWILMHYAISRTLILDDALPNAWPRFSIPALTLISVKGPLPDPKALKQTYDLTCTANSYAQRNFIGSLLAGPGSESDEFADVGFWCGEIDENNIETSILQSLSLGIWIQKANRWLITQITRLADAPLKTLRKSEMWESCEALSDLTEFRVERPDTGGRVMHVMAGKGLEGWCLSARCHRVLYCIHPVRSWQNPDRLEWLPCIAPEVSAQRLLRHAKCASSFAPHTTQLSNDEFASLQHPYANPAPPCLNTNFR
ncbi:hypothetical protein AG1IA_01331 [Rhizoctonia solani AG-1 IA]|uniref:Uncharacterized protein n=1 Tax=Thanatephorus cucumeris (strain AG1-IA) TaxID=983506 RepID=L8X7L7_THACA|nr:hypothetical protein AG1IA_01331 [Rhizoctonia solani AG-1 IA]